MLLRSADRHRLELFARSGFPKAGGKLKGHLIHLLGRFSG